MASPSPNVHAVNEREMQYMYKHDEIRQHYIDWLAEQPADWIEENQDDLHQHCFNTDYYIIGTYQAVQWLGDQVFNIKQIIKEYELEHFGQVEWENLCDPEKIVNMYVYIVGEQVVHEHKEIEEV